ncbi:glutathione S-transferase family protein [Nitratireductor sp. ZSWI3]|uniref:glutathione S-transferase family protein n=1 Tax=Nitratireductor sp. ZSWI3 TaxID=2966359 RepID=UPI00214FD3C5|nr:glutathione S-transferase family protein [Nitratireductor sp. ZSWI3]MCR4268983.1 glutathione S-transferase family protein [Nitratireductor sp. ZSWI3]
MTGKPQLFGADYSVYVRIARLALLEKGVDHELVPVDIFSRDGVPDWYLERHPFRKIPTFEHGALRLFETAAITRYVDEAFDGPALQHGDAGARAVTNQIIGLIDAYAYRSMVWDVYVERVSKPKRGETADEALIAGALDTAGTCLSTLSSLSGQGPWLAGNRLTLADLHAAPVFAYFSLAPEGAAMIARYPRIADWWERMRGRASFEATRPSD